MVAQTRTNDAARRALRTFVQGFIGVLILVAIPALNELVGSVGTGGEVRIDVNFWREVLIAAVAGGVIALVSFVQNELEQATGTDVLPK